MTVNTVILLVADPVLLDKLADRHFVNIKFMQEVALVASLACVPQPMDANLLLSFFVTDLVRM